jgi:flagellar biosynthetic protein FliS
MNAIARYKTNHVGGSSPEQLLLTLLEGAIRRQTGAVAAIEDRDWPAMHRQLDGVREILGELNAALDDSVAPEICGRLHRLYAWGIVETARAARERSAARVVHVRRTLEVLHQAWSELDHRPTR